MDKISGLPDELLVKIITLVPTKVAVSTSILSKRWKFLWMFCTKLEYTDRDKDTYDDRPKPRLWEFVDKNLPLHRAPVIESFRLHSSNGGGKPEDFKRWIEFAVSRCVRELVIYHYFDDGINLLPNRFYTCKSLVYLKLSFVALIDVPSTGCFLPSLKTLKLKYVSYPKEASSLQQLLSACPVLEELLMDFGEGVTEFTVIVPSLKSLSIFIPMNCPDLHGYVIDTPSLEYFKIEDMGELWHEAEIKNMPKLREACIYDTPDLKSFMKSITSVKRLTICPSQDRYGDGFVFNQLEHLEICACMMDPLNLLSQLLSDSPNLRVLDISVVKEHEDREMHYYNDGVCWNQPSDVPECLLSTLQIFNWSRYFGRPHDRDTAVYMLKHGRHLKTATIVADSEEQDVSNFTMITELALSSRASSLCELVFVGNESH
ncbi:FBD domain-containing protein [Hirschfeldia incana]|nr:FBD domain-containing protein [Hirschfeldia incana]KAJ0250586.1 FBD domain-containing protein [Hirschfeldia incana]